MSARDVMAEAILTAGKCMGVLANASSVTFEQKIAGFQIEALAAAGYKILGPDEIELETMKAALQPTQPVYSRRQLLARAEAAERERDALGERMRNDNLYYSRWLREKRRSAAANAKLSGCEIVAWQKRIGRSNRHTPDVWAWSEWSDGRWPDDCRDREFTRYESRPLYTMPASTGRAALKDQRK